MVFRVVNANCIAPLVACTGVDAHFQFVVQTVAGQESGIGIRCLELALGTLEIHARDADAGGTAVVADGHPLVVLHQRIGGAKQLAHIGGVIDGGVEVRVVAHLHGHGVFNVGLRHQAGLECGFGGRASTQGARQGQAQGRPLCGVHAHQCIELALSSGIDLRLHISVQGFGIAHGGHVQHLIANGYTAAKGFTATSAAKDREGQVLDGEVALAGVGAGHPALQAGVVGFVQCHVHLLESISLKTGCSAYGICAICY